MRLKIRVNAEFAFVTSALLVLLMGWTSDFFTALAAGHEAAHGGGNLFFRLNITFFGLGLAAIGVGWQHLDRFLRDPSWSIRYVVGYLILADGVIHGFAFNDHLAEPAQAAFFALVTPTQVVVGLGLPYLRQGLDPVWLGLTAFLIAAYVATRTLVFWPVGVIEEVETLGILSKVLEFLAVVLLVQMIRRQRRASIQTAHEARPESSAAPP